MLPSMPHGINSPVKTKTPAPTQSIMLAFSSGSFTHYFNMIRHGIQCISKTKRPYEQAEIVLLLLHWMAYDDLVTRHP